MGNAATPARDVRDPRMPGCDQANSRFRAKPRMQKMLSNKMKMCFLVALSLRFPVARLVLWIGVDWQAVSGCSIGDSDEGGWKPWFPLNFTLERGPSLQTTI